MVPWHRVAPGNTPGAFAYPAPNTTGNANFDAVLNQWVMLDLGPKTITVKNLVAGHNYSVLLIGLDARGLPSVAGSAPARFAYFQDPVVATDVSPTFQMGENVYVMASFLAQTTTQTIIETLPTGNNGDMNALVVYDLSAVVTAPTLNVALVRRWKFDADMVGRGHAPANDQSSGSRGRPTAPPRRLT